jgi:hypothetical protein
VVLLGNCPDATTPQEEGPNHPSIIQTGDASSPRLDYTSSIENRHNLQITRPLLYVSIRIKGHLDSSWQEYLEGLEIVQEADGTTRLSGVLQDQSALYGVLNMMSRLNLSLLSVEMSERAQKELP